MARHAQVPVVDPTKIGPVDRCITCFHYASDKVAYCENCGRQRGFLVIERSDWEGKTCNHHPGAAAITACVLCGQPICKACVEREGVSLISAEPTPQCTICVARIEELESAF